MPAGNVILLLIVALIPLQLNKFFWPQSAFVSGIPIDYLAPTIYMTDFLILAYLFLSLRNWGKITLFLKDKKVFLIPLLIFIFYYVSEAFFLSPSPTAIFKAAKLLEFSPLSLFAAYTFSQNGFFKKARNALIISLFLESGLLIIQFALQRSLGLGFLGERNFDTTTPAIAHFALFGRQLLRPYGTFPHPNVAAAFIVFAQIIILSKRKVQFSKNLPANLISAIALFITFSKSAAISALISLAILFPKLKKPLLILASFAGLYLITRGFPEHTLPTIAERLVLSQASLDITAKHLFLGVGPTNFIPSISKLNLFSISEVRLLQPVHNVFLLILSENGIIGFTLFALVIFSLTKFLTTKTKLTLLLFLLVYASVDHFFWTLNQGQLLFWLSIAFILASPKPRLS